MSIQILSPLTFGAVIVWHRPVAVERDADLPALPLLELFAISLDGIGVREDDTVANTAIAERTEPGPKNGN